MDLPEGITWIQKNTFEYCDRLTSVTIPQSVTRIEERAFYRCKSLKKLTIPSNVTYIGERAFTLVHNVEYLCSVREEVPGNDLFSVCVELLKYLDR